MNRINCLRARTPHMALYTSAPALCSPGRQTTKWKKQGGDRISIDRSCEPRASMQQLGQPARQPCVSSFYCDRGSRHGGVSASVQMLVRIAAGTGGKGMWLKIGTYYAYIVHSKCRHWTLSFFSCALTFAQISHLNPGF